MNSNKVIKRSLDIDLPAGQSAFLWGARKTGKTTLLKRHFPDSTYYDLLETDLLMHFTKAPHTLREEIVALLDAGELRQPVIIDEVQKVPKLLDEIHALIEGNGISFILCGSSARKLKRAGTNLLGGRAWSFTLLPFTSRELGGRFDLLHALNRGLIPSHYLGPRPERSLKAYVNDYLKEEIHDEGLTRNLPAFARFLDVAALCNGEMINYTNVGRDCGVDSKTVAEYYHILSDTLLGFFIEPFRKQKRRQIITSTSKFYLFDVGVVGSINRRTLNAEKGHEFGKAFEHLMLMEIRAQRTYSEQDTRVSYWRTKTGEEVDFILDNGRIAIEIKSTERVDRRDLKGLRAFVEEHSPERAIVVCREKRRRKLGDGTEIIPWRTFLSDLWDDKL